MLLAVKTWLLAGAPPHYVTIAAVVAYSLLEWALPRLKIVKANSTIEALANLAKKALLDRVPLLGRLVSMLATPDVPMAILPPDEPKAHAVGSSR